MVPITVDTSVDTSPSWAGTIMVLLAFASLPNSVTHCSTSSSADLEDPYAIDVRSYRLSSKGSEMVAIALEDDKNEDIDAPVADYR